MDTFITVLVITAMIALGVLVIRLLNTQHDERITAFPYGRAKSDLRTRPVADPPMPRRHATSRSDGARRDRRASGSGRLWLRRRLRK
ncbi:hypothetical protein [Streptomyces sp. NBC_00829]|uniref:hypothetical protein n=1 Tax=Streptomyces sp. NBC_00829 TaxID=2903679 RepID=UPI003867D618|nr:hypothetical protein OG293_16545 [Streptomyces sp. NBC_00829]